VVSLEPVPAKLKKNQKKYEAFIELLEYWLNRLHVFNGRKERPIEYGRDNRYSGFAVTECYDDKFIVKYNARRMGHLSYAMLVNVVFHEIGHIKHNLRYNTHNEQVKSEYVAERYAIQKMKCYYPYHLSAVAEYTRKKLASRKWVKDNPVHAEAFKKIREYK